MRLARGGRCRRGLTESRECNGKAENDSRERRKDKVEGDLRHDDNQLYEALNLLKGIALSHATGLEDDTTPGSREQP